jgi:hypothetical protein
MASLPSIPNIPNIPDEDTKDVSTNTVNQLPLRIGVDMGGVCVHKGQEYEDDRAKFHRVMDMPNCVEILRLLKAKGHYIVLVSFCGRSRATDTSKSLRKPNHTDLFDEMYFVKNKSFKDAIAKHLALDVMIDDRWDILENMHTVYRLHFTADVPAKKMPQKKRWKKNERFDVIDWKSAYKTITQLQPRGNKPIVLSKSDLSNLCHSTY